MTGDVWFHETVYRFSLQSWSGNRRPNQLTITFPETKRLAKNFLIRECHRPIKKGCHHHQTAQNNKTKYVAYSLFSINMIILKHPSYHFPLNQRRPLQCTKIEAHVTCREVSAQVACQASIKCSWRDLLESILTFFTSFLFSFCFFPCHLSNNLPPTSILSAWASIPCGPRCLLADPAFSKRWFRSLAAKKTASEQKVQKIPRDERQKIINQYPAVHLT